jgi:hypothetical protein
MALDYKEFQLIGDGVGDTGYNICVHQRFLFLTHQLQKQVYLSVSSTTYKDI